jgi:hypothetical protein
MANISNLLANGGGRYPRSLVRLYLEAPSTELGGHRFPFELYIDALLERYRMLKAATPFAWGLCVAVIIWRQFSWPQIAMVGLILFFTSKTTALSLFRRWVIQVRQAHEAERSSAHSQTQDTRTWPLEDVLFDKPGREMPGPRHLLTGRLLRRPLPHGFIFVVAAVAGPVTFIAVLLTVPTLGIAAGAVGAVLVWGATNYLRLKYVWPFRTVIFRRFPRTGDPNEKDAGILAMLRVLGTYGHATVVQSFPFVPSGWHALRARLARLWVISVYLLPMPHVGVSVEFVQRSDEEWHEAVTTILMDADFVVVDATDISKSVAWELDAAAATLPPERILLIASDAFQSLDGFTFEENLVHARAHVSKVRRVAFQNSVLGRMYLQARLLTRMRAMADCG